MHEGFIPAGVIPAVLLPFHDDLSIDEASFRRHLQDVASVRGVSALTVNAHSTEVASCTFEEQRRVLAIARDEVGSRLPLVHGVYADGSLEAARIAAMAEAGGASALLVFPPGPFTLGQRPEMVVEHFRRIADAPPACRSSLSSIRSPPARAIPAATLEALLDAVPTIRAIKDWCADVSQHERHIRTLQSRSPRRACAQHAQRVAVQLPRARLQRPAVGLRQRDRRPAGAACSPPCRPTTSRTRPPRSTTASSRWPRLFYAAPRVDMHNRMKEALVLLGRLPRAVVRPPLVKLPDAEIDRIAVALRQAGLSKGQHRLQAA